MLVPGSAASRNTQIRFD